MDAYDTKPAVEGRQTAVPAQRSARNQDEPFGVPSRFGIGTLLVVTTAYGVFLSVLLALNADRRAVVWILIFLSLVGAGQMLLFGSRRPRRASLVAGAIALPILALASSLVHGGDAPPAIGLICAMMWGAPAGYLAGGIVAGVFLVMDAVDNALKRRRR